MKGLAIIFLLPCMVFAQPVDTVWTRHIGNAVLNVALDGYVTADGGLMLGGRGGNADSGSYFELVKLTSSGVVQFQRPFAVGEGSQCNGIAGTPDGGCIAAGQHTDEWGWYDDMYVVKTTSIGDTQWTFSTDTQETDETAATAIGLRDGGFLVGGYIAQQAVLIRLAANGGLLWSHSIQAADYSIRDIFERPGGGFVVCGWGTGNSGYDFITEYVDANGTPGGSRAYGTGADDWGGKASMAEDGSLWMAGSSWNTNTDIYVVRTDSARNMLWDQTINFGGNEEGRDIVALSDGGAAVIAYRTTNQSNSDLFLIRFNAVGDTLWTKRWRFNTMQVSPLAIDIAPQGYMVAGWVRYGIGGDANMFGARIDGDVGSVSGTVRSAVTHEPLSGVRVTCEGSTVSAITDSNGTYRITLVANTYDLRYERIGYCTGHADGFVITGGQTRTSDVEMGRVEVSLDITSFNVAGWSDQTIGFHLSAAGSECPLEFIISDTSDWISINPATGYVDPAQPAELEATFLLSGLPAGEYFSEIIVSSPATEFPFHVPVMAYVTLAADDAVSSIPSEFGITAIYPNPFNATATVEFSLPRAAMVQMSLYDILGRNAADLLNGITNAGQHRLQINGGNLPTGSYIIRLTTAGRTSERSIVLVK